MAKILRRIKDLERAPNTGRYHCKGCGREYSFQEGTIMSPCICGFCEYESCDKDSGS